MIHTVPPRWAFFGPGHLWSLSFKQDKTLHYTEHWFNVREK